MKSKFIRSIILPVVLVNLLFSGCLAGNTVGESERDRLFNNGWKFIRDSIAGAEKPDYDDSKWMTVDLPHDYSMMDLPGIDGPDQVGPFSKKSPGNGNSTGQVMGGTGWYRKSFLLQKEDEGKTVILNFDGVYMESEIWVNGKKAGIHTNGYTPFWFDITSLLNSTGKPNVIAVKVENIGRNSRWYSGSGIYRNVHLTLTQPVHVAVWGVQISTPEISQNMAMVELAVTLNNKIAKVVNAEISIRLLGKDNTPAGVSSERVVLPSNGEYISKKRMKIEKPVLWSLEDPTLYKAEISVKVDNKLVDNYTQTFGIRSISFSADKGFQLNGKSLELKGGCLHHDNGLLGSAAYDRAEERRVELMKANGYNAIRCAHNPPSTAFLDACDKLGMLVIDEFTDMWEYYKNPQDYSRFFKEWWNRDLTTMMLRDRNHPSIIMWSIGNEIFEPNDSTRLRIGKQLAERVRELDQTRPVTQAINEFFYPNGWESTLPAFALLDICGYNYGVDKYAADHQKYPQRIIFSSESYPIDAYDYWKPVEEFSWVIGEFVWSSMDYLGEVAVGSTRYVPGSGIKVMKMPAGFKIPKGMNIFDQQVRQPTAWPAFVAGCGDIDITGGKKPQMLYRDILWNNSKIEINIHAPLPEGFGESISMWGWPDEWPSWNWKGSEGKPLQVRVFTKATEVRLELNGRVVGEKALSAGDKYIAVFEVPYQPGELKAIALNNGKEIASRVLKTTGEAFAIRLVADRNTLHADRNDLSFVMVEVVDKNGLVVPDAALKVKLILIGNGELAATGNADPKDMASVNNPVIITYKGKAQAIVRPFEKTGTITLQAESEGLESASLSILSKQK